VQVQAYSSITAPEFNLKKVSSASEHLSKIAEAAADIDKMFSQVVLNYKIHCMKKSAGILKTEIKTSNCQVKFTISKSQLLHEVVKKITLASSFIKKSLAQIHFVFLLLYYMEVAFAFFVARVEETTHSTLKSLCRQRVAKVGYQSHITLNFSVKSRITENFFFTNQTSRKEN